HLTNTQDQLIHSEKMASLGGLVAGVAHEINTPVGMGLTGITHFLDISKKIKQLYIDDDMSEEEFEEFLNTSNDLANSINANLVRAADLIRSFKQVAVDQSSEAKRIFNLNVYIQEVLVSLRNFTKKTKINIVVDCPRELKINSYPGSFSQIITNLVMNSLHHGFSPGEKGKIVISMKLEGNSLMMKYTDDGKGIKKEDLPRIYDPFYTTNREDGGSGLGMNILYNIVTTSFNGKIECISAENEGVVFLIEMNDIEFIR
ncbi:MAG: HAMP domain-containing histidine kinase, partial [Campylobacteraceae bacterium]|nr:HAMP domain-containing histidine kinase [Campylobacteraceae bacterium]